MTSYKEYTKMHVAVDCLIFGLEDGKLKLLLTQRSFEPEKGKWSLIGGFVRLDESAEDAASRVLKDLTGLDNVYLRQVGTFSKVDRDPGERVISIAYCALLGVDDCDHDGLKAYSARWFDINNLPELGFDHPEMVEIALKFIRANIPFSRIGRKLLPGLFTLSQLQKLYESILGCPIDKRNFRRKVLELDIIKKTEFIDKESSRRGAFLYKFDIEQSLEEKSPVIIN